VCGIAGVIALDGTPVDRGHLVSLAEILAHRGPDDSGIFYAPAVGLMQRRLSIIDTSAAGHGPMPNEDHTVWITYNGEVYNYRELMPDLARRGHRFRSACDTEVVLHAYEEYGEQCVERFNGMFAFAIWDAHRGRLFCARDRCGVKPFYYAEAAGRFAFASEIKALFIFPWIRAEPNQARVMDYLVAGIVDHTDETFFTGIHSLSAGATLTIGPDHRSSRTYWRLPTLEEGPLVGRPSARLRQRWAEELEAHLLDSVRLRLRSDVTVGSCLSGGIDSSTLVSMVNRLLIPDQADERTINESWHRGGERQMTFSACFDDPAIDERRYMDTVVARTGVAARFTYPRGDELARQLASVVWHQDEPFLSTGILAQWEVMRLANANGVKVLLDGQGADELLCGYVGYIGPFLADLFTRGRFEDLSRELTLFRMNYGGRYGSPERLMAQALRARHPWLRPDLTARLDSGIGVPSWLGDEQTAWLARNQWAPPQGYAPNVRGYLPSMTDWFFARGSLPALLRYEDRNSMAFGVEARVPFLDYRLVEFVFRQPNAFRMEDGLGKRTLRRVARRWTPREVWTRRDKLGFTTPEAAWLRGPARTEVERLMSDLPPSFDRFVRPDAARAGFSTFLAGGGDSAMIWRWVNLALWLRMFVDNRSGAARPSVQPMVAP
jgi:asparagine synthase (glutamine-hydrolysing)